MSTEVKPLISYHGNPATKEKYIARMKKHMDADELVQGSTGNGGKGCAIWCTLNKYAHEPYETELGIPRILAKLEDRIFEGLSVRDSKAFPLAFLKAVPVGKSLDSVWRKFFIWMLVDPQDGVIKYAKTDSGKKAIQDVADLISKSLTIKITSGQYRDAAYAADADAAAAHAADAADARRIYYKKMAVKLLELLAAA